MSDGHTAPTVAGGDFTEVTLAGLQFHARVGILPHERTLPQPVEIDITVACAPGADIVDYRAIYSIAERITAAGGLDYLEHIAERVATAVLQEMPVLRVRVAIRKPHVALPGPLAYAEAVVTRRRDA